MQITVNASKKYDIEIGRGLLSSCGKLIKSVVNSAKSIIITDSNVDLLYSSVVENSLTENGFEVLKYVLPAGEKSKSIENYANILTFLANSGAMRGDVIVALGGGVVGDIAGFVAATYMRGVNYVQIPTTLLAVIDSSVGGKTAIDLPEGKNLVGAFYQPEIVIADVDTFKTLPSDVWIDGMGELAKYAILTGGETERLVLDGVEKNIERLVYLCINYKKEVVERDEFEKGERKLLNLGHTIAHAVEKLSGYTVTHGKAVAIGLAVIARACLNNGDIVLADYERVVKVLKKVNCSQDMGFDIKAVCKAAVIDKKLDADGITMVLLGGMGKPRLEKMSIERMEEYLCK